MATFLERKISNSSNIYNYDYYMNSAAYGNMSLLRQTSNWNQSFQSVYLKLVPNLQIENNPNDAMSLLPYERGFQFLHFLEETISPSLFQKFITDFYKNNSKKSTNSIMFKFSLKEFCDVNQISSKFSELDIDSWYNDPFPSKLKNISFPAPSLKEAEDLALAFVKSTSIPAA